MTTLSHLRALLYLALTHADNPALSRCERTVEGVAVEYLGATLAEAIRLHETEPLAELYWLRMDKPAKVHALLVALALALGLDPGVGGVGVCWYRALLHPGWHLFGEASSFFFGAVETDACWTDVLALAVARETNPIAALEAAVKHTLENPC